MLRKFDTTFTGNIKKNVKKKKVTFFFSYKNFLILNQNSLTFRKNLLLNKQTLWPCKQSERDLILTKFSILFSPLIMKLHWFSSQWVTKSLRAQLVLLGVSTEMSNVQIPLPPTIELSKKNILLGDSRRTCKTSPNYLNLLEFFSLIFWTKTRPLSSQNHQHNSSSMSIANPKNSNLPF